MRDTTIAAPESIDFFVQIGIVQEVWGITAIAPVERELGNGRPSCTTIFRFDETSPTDGPCWDRVSKDEAGEQ